MLLYQLLCFWWQHSLLEEERHGGQHPAIREGVNYYWCEIINGTEGNINFWSIIITFTTITIFPLVLVCYVYNIQE